MLDILATLPLYFLWSFSKVLTKRKCFSALIEDIFILANSADPDKMLLSAVSHLNFHCFSM